MTQSQNTRRVVVDPLTRVEGHLRVQAVLDENNVIVDSQSTGTMWRGLEVILKGRDPRDAWAFVERICGVCTGIHALAAVRSVEDAIGIKIPKNANIIRNLMNATLYVHDHLVHFYQLSAEEGCAEGLAMMGELLYEGKGCRKSPAQARKFWKKAADAGDVAAWVALGDDAMVQGKGVGAALRAYRKAQKLCASTPDVAYMPQVCLRVAQYETQYISRKQALAQLAEAKQGFLIRQKEGDETARSWLDETERVIRQLLEKESG